MSAESSRHPISATFWMAIVGAAAFLLLAFTTTGPLQQGVHALCALTFALRALGGRTGWGLSMYAASVALFASILLGIHAGMMPWALVMVGYGLVLYANTSYAQATIRLPRGDPRWTGPDPYEDGVVSWRMMAHNAVLEVLRVHTGPYEARSLHDHGVVVHHGAYHDLHDAQNAAQAAAH